MELRFRGDPEDCVKSPATDGKARRLGDTLELRLGVPADARFLRPRLRLSGPWPWPPSPRAAEGRGLCLLEGDCLALLAPAEMVKTILLLASLSGSEKLASQGRSPLPESGSGPRAPSRGLAQSWGAGEAEPQVRGCVSRGGCCGVELRDPTVAKRLPELEDSSRAGGSAPGPRGAGLPARAPLMATEPLYAKPVEDTRWWLGFLHAWHPWAFTVPSSPLLGLRQLRAWSP